MNKLELKEVTREYAVYRYRPEGRGSYGEVRMNIGDEEPDVTVRSDEDVSGRYAHKAAKALKLCVSERNFPLDFTQAWV